jgi:hypothetical protein
MGEAEWMTLYTLSLLVVNMTLQSQSLVVALTLVLILVLVEAWTWAVALVLELMVSAAARVSVGLCQPSLPHHLVAKTRISRLEDRPTVPLLVTE